MKRQLSYKIRDFKIQRRGRQRKTSKKIKNRFGKQNINFTLFCTFLFPFLHDYDVKMPNFAFCGGRKQATSKFYFSFCTWIWSERIQFQEGSPTFDKVSG